MEEVTTFYCSGTQLQPAEATTQTHYTEKESIKHLVPYLVYKCSRTVAAQVLRQVRTELLILPCISCGLLYDTANIPDYKAANVTMTDK
jgi:hypothetical protein